MKKIISIILFLCAVCFTACTGRDQDVLHLGLDAKVVEVDAEHSVKPKNTDTRYQCAGVFYSTKNKISQTKQCPFSF